MDPERGGGLELLLTKLKTARHKPQMILLSAVLEDVCEFDQWLGCELLVQRKRPVELREGVVDWEGTFRYREWNSGTVGKEHFSCNSLDELVGKLLDQQEQVVVIGNTIHEVESTATRLASAFTHLPAASKTTNAVKDLTDSETRNLLLKTLRHSVAFHHADCELEERLAVERGFREGQIRVLSATTTLAMGVNLPAKSVNLPAKSVNLPAKSVNLPAKSVNLADNWRWSVKRGNYQQVPWKVGDVRNIFGRAGRLGRESDFGRGMLLADDQRELVQVRRAYLDARLEKLESTFENRDIGLRVLDIVATGFAGSANEVSKFIFSTFAASRWKGVAASKQIQNHISEGLERCKQLGLVRSEKGSLRATQLGRVCTAKGCSLNSLGHLMDFVDRMGAVDVLDVIFIAAGTEDLSGGYYCGVKWNDMRRATKMWNLLHDSESKGELGTEVSQAYGSAQHSAGNDLRRQFTMALLARDILKSDHGQRDLRDAYDFSTANVRKMCLDLSWMLDVIQGIAEIQKPEVVNELSTLSDCLQHRFPLSAAYLTRIRPVLSRDETLRLVHAGIKTSDDFLEHTPDEFRNLISPAKANLIIQYLTKTRTRSHEFWQRDQLRRLDARGFRVSELKEAYEQAGDALDKAICNIFETGFADCSAQLIRDQRKGEPDLQITFPNGSVMTVQVTAKQNDARFVDSKKAGDVIPQSARLHPDAYMCVGRPEFQDLARELATHQAKQWNFKLLPVFVLAELYVRFRERRLTPIGISDFLLNASVLSQKFAHKSA